MRKIKLIFLAEVFCILLVLFFTLKVEGSQLVQINESSSSLSPEDVHGLIKDIPTMKVRTYRYSPQVILLNVIEVFKHPECVEHKRLFEAILNFSYMSQVLNYQNKTTKQLYSEAKHLIKQFVINGGLNDMALLELIKLADVFETQNSATLLSVIDAKNYPFPAYKFFAKYLYVSLIKNEDEEKWIKYDKEVSEEAFDNWKNRRPENIIGNPNSLIAISKALAAEEDIYFDFMHYFNLLQLNREKNKKKINFTDAQIENYINIISKKFPNHPYFLNNFRVWFLSVMKAGYSFDTVLRLFNDVMKTGTDQQKALAFEHLTRHMKYFKKQSSCKNFLQEIEKLIERLRLEEDGYGLRSIALGYLHMNIDNLSNQKALKLLQYVQDITDDFQLINLIEEDTKKTENF